MKNILVLLLLLFTSCVAGGQGIPAPYPNLSMNLSVMNAPPANPWDDYLTVQVNPTWNWTSQSVQSYAI